MDLFKYFIDNAILFLFGGVMVFTVARIIYKALRPSTKSEAKDMARRIANMYDPVTGLPRNIVEKEPQVYIEEIERK
jgi:uncharacterized lipoprotein YehR (DUF1307 family)